MNNTTEENTAIGHHAGSDIKDESGYIIIGHGISMKDVQEKTRKDVVFLGKKFAVSTEVWNAICKTLGIEGEQKPFIDERLRELASLSTITSESK